MAGREEEFEFKLKRRRSRRHAPKVLKDLD